MTPQDKGIVLSFTGLSASDKSTLSNTLAREVSLRGFHLMVPDEDVLRTHLSKELVFSKEDHEKNT